MKEKLQQNEEESEEKSEMASMSVSQELLHKDVTPMAAGSVEGSLEDRFDVVEDVVVPELLG